MKGPFTILVVDDEPPICDILTRIAKKEFPEAHFINTRSAKETFEYLANRMNEWPKLVLLDIDLNQTVNGLDFLPQLQNVLDKRVPIIILSWSTEESSVKKAYEIGATAYTQKPSSLQEWNDYVTRLRLYWYKANNAPFSSGPEEVDI